MTQPNKIIDSWLVIQYQSGQSKGISLLVKRWHPKLCKHACYYTKDMDSAQDIVQESWKVILRKINSLRDPNEFGSWVLSITTRKAIDYLRQQQKDNKRKKEYHDQTTTIATTDATPLDDTSTLVLQQLLEKLPVEQRQVLTLFYREEFSIREISEICNIPVGTVKSRLYNAREYLKQTLKHRNYEK